MLSIVIDSDNIFRFMSLCADPIESKTPPATMIVHSAHRRPRDLQTSPHSSSQRTILPHPTLIPRLHLLQIRDPRRILTRLAAAQRPRTRHLDPLGTVRAALLAARDLAAALHIPVVARHGALAGLAGQSGCRAGRVRTRLLGGCLQGLEQVDGGFRGQVLVVVVVDLHHGRVGAGAQALDFGEGEEAVGGRLAVVDSQVRGDGVHDGVGVAQLARCLGVWA
jgi:hypothetical protein